MAQLQYEVNGGNATYGVDYMIFTGGNSYNPYCKRSGQLGVGCVEFGDGSPLETVTFKVLNDSVYEGNETFHVNIIQFPHMAHVSYPNRLTIIILDSSKRECCNYNAVIINSRIHCFLFCSAHCWFRVSESF